MIDLTRTGIFIAGAVLGFCIAVAIAGWLWLFRTKGFDRPLTDEEAKKHVAETWEGK